MLCAVWSDRDHTRVSYVTVALQLEIATTTAITMFLWVEQAIVVQAAVTCTTSLQHAKAILLLTAMVHQLYMFTANIILHQLATCPAALHIGFPQGGSMPTTAAPASFNNSEPGQHKLHCQAARVLVQGSGSGFSPNPQRPHISAAHTIAPSFSLVRLSLFMDTDLVSNRSSSMMDATSTAAYLRYFPRLLVNCTSACLRTSEAQGGGVVLT